MATGDTGPLRGRYGGPRDLVVGMRVALSDGTLAKSGGKVIKNVAGYDIAKLFGGSFGTLGAIVEVSVRLHPVAPDTATAIGEARDADELARGAAAVGGSALEHHGIDIRFSGGRGAVLVRFAGAVPRPQAEAAEQLLREEGLATEIVDDDERDLGRAARRPARPARGEGVLAPDPAPGAPAGGGRAGRLGRGPRRAGAVVGALRGAVA